MLSVGGFLFFFCFGLIAGDGSMYRFLKFGEEYFYDIPENCTKILNSFADSAANFARCSIEHARPVKLCQQCVQDYVQFSNKYAELLTTEVNHTSCKSIYLSHDRFEVVLEYYNSGYRIWDKGNCGECFDWTNPQEPQISNSTKEFNSAINKTIECIKTNYKPDMNNTDEVCQKCATLYIWLDEYYKTLSSDAIGVDSVCMDIVDSMNTTRSIWSKELKCCNLRRHPEIIFLCATGIISFLPFLFYVVVRYCGPIRDLPNVLKQTRFIKQTIQRSATDGRIN